MKEYQKKKINLIKNMKKRKTKKAGHIHPRLKQQK